jgi:hypothetical protein
MYGLDNCKIELVELYSCSSKEELRQKEGEYIKNNECVNKHVAGRTQVEYVSDNRDRINERKRNWVNKNKERINEVRRARDKEFRQANPELAKQKDQMEYVRRKEYFNKKNNDWKAEHQAEVKEYRENTTKRIKTN